MYLARNPAQYHGRSHFDTRAWTAYLASGDPVSSLYFDNGLTYYHYGRRNETSGLFHSTHSEYRSDDHVHQRPLPEMAAWISDGVAAFEEFWGFPAKVTAMPCHYGFDALAPLFQSAGISQVEGESNGRGLLADMQNMFRVLFDPVFEPAGSWENALARAQEQVLMALADADHIALQVSFRFSSRSLFVVVVVVGSLRCNSRVGLFSFRSRQRWHRLMFTISPCLCVCVCV